MCFNHYICKMKHFLNIMLVQKFTYCCLIVFFSLTIRLTGQQMKSGVIIQAHSYDLRALKEVMKNSLRNAEVGISKIELLNEETGLFYISFQEPIDELTLSQVRNIQGIENANFDEYLELRSNPDDPNYNKQYAIGLTKINEVWETTTGGKTSDNKEIVVAVIDDGIDIDHEDIVVNIFANTAEIPNDGVDNDANGIVDDYRVFNVDNSNGDPLVKSHGTSVTGILGAAGNNSKGVTGVNWNIRILAIVGVNMLSEIIKSYDHVLRMKRAYVSSNGVKGANVMVTSYSGGISRVFADQAPYKPWCELYNLLGSEGVLSVGSAPNENVDVDVVGDMPSTCTSPYFICVTNIDNAGQKVIQAGYGKASVDLGAPGEDIETTKPQNSYGTISGTSASAPIVAGTAALLFSVPCAPLAQLIELNPRAAVEAVRDAILLGVSPSSTLDGKTSSNGNLDAFGALKLMAEPCDGTLVLPSVKGPLEITDVQIVSQEIYVEYTSPDDEDVTLMITNTLGKILVYKEYQQQLFGQRILIHDMGEVAAGVYFVSIIHGKEIATVSIWK